MEEEEEFYNGLLEQESSNLKAIKAQGGAAYATPNFSSISTLLNKCGSFALTQRNNKCVFIDFGSGTGNVLFLAERMLSHVCDTFVGVEFNPIVNDEALKRKNALDSKCTFEQADITSLSVKWLLQQSGEEQKRHIILFSFDCRMPSNVVQHTISLFKDYPLAITFISTWSPHYCKMQGTLFSPLVIGANGKYVFSADNEENFDEDQLDAFDEKTTKQTRDIQKQMQKDGVEFEPSLLSEQFEMYMYEKVMCTNCAIKVAIGLCGHKCGKAAYCSKKCATFDYRRHIKEEKCAILN